MVAKYFTPQEEKANEAESLTSNPRKLEENRPPKIIMKPVEKVPRNVYALTLSVLFGLTFLILCSTWRNMYVLAVWGRNTVLVYDGKGKSIAWPDPPPYQNIAAVARYVMHISEWGSLSTYSTHKGIEGYPFVSVFSVSDGPIGNSTGVPYFYLTPTDLSVKDIEVNNKVSFTVSEAQSEYCNKKRYDPEDPRCAHVILSGTVKKLENGTEEEEFARHALFSRHEQMKDWPAKHDWFFAKLDIIHIYVLDYFGGDGIVAPEQYFAVDPFQAKRG